MSGEPRAVAALRRVEAGLLVAFALALPLSIAATEIAFFLALAARLARARLGDPLSLRPRSVAWAWAGLAAAWLLAGVLSPEPAQSLLRVHRLYVVMAAFLVADAARDPRRAGRLVAAYLVGAGLGSAYGVAAWLHQSLVSDASYRLEASFSTAMTAGNVLATAFVAAFAAFLVERGRRRWLVAVVGACVATALAATHTRSSWIGALAGAGTAALVGRSRRWAVLALVALAAAVAAVPALRVRATSAFDPRDPTVQGRVSLWRTGWELFGERPLVGWGLADQMHRIALHRRPDATFVAGHFHNNLVQVAVTGGVAALAAYVALHAALAWALWRRRRGSRWAAAALGVWVAFQAAGLFDWSFGDAEVVYQFFFWMGLGLADNREDPARLVDPSRAPC